MPAEIFAAAKFDHGIPISGKFGLWEATTVDPVPVKEVATGEVFEYHMVISGTGGTAFMLSEVINRKEFEVNLVGVETDDFISNDTLYADKTIRYQIIPKTGVLGKKNISAILGPIRYYNTTTKTLEHVVPTKSITVSNKSKNNKIPTVKLSSDSTMTFLFLVDISQSMDIEDFTPRRLGFVKKELKELIDGGYSIEPIIFAGIVKPWATRTSLKSTDSISSDLIMDRGTAIGNAIWFAINYAKTSGRNYSKKIILAGDGDNTAGNISTSMAADYALANGYSIYTIGVGSPGKAPFGKDFFGNPHRVEDTFSEKDLKMISAKTKGQYFRMIPTAPAHQLIRNLKLILAKP
jgi:hypothetical protein